jgi:probable addiction module antidote protein
MARVRMIKLTKFDAAEYLDSAEVIAEYLNAALEDDNPNVFLTAARDVAKARGMTELAKHAGLGRESLHKALTSGVKPRYDTILKVIRALGVELRTVPLHQKPVPTGCASERAGVGR